MRIGIIVFALLLLLIGGMFLFGPFSWRGGAPAAAMMHDIPMNGMNRGMGGMSGMPSMLRHQYVMRNGIPAAYRDASNPLPATAENIRAGGRLFASNCATCHGPQGLGNGPAGRDLDPPPANIARFVRSPMANDPYLFWTISEGGAPVGSAMPAFKSVLSDTARWQIIRYLRAGFPEVE